MNLPTPSDVWECDLLLTRAVQHRDRNTHDPYILAAVPLIIDGLLDHRLELDKTTRRHPAAATSSTTT